MSSEFESDQSAKGQSQNVVLYCRTGRLPTKTEDRQQSGQCEQEAQLRDWVRRLLDGPIEVRVVKVDCEEKSRDAAFASAMDVIQAGWCNVFVVKSLDRIGREFRVFELLEIAAKSKTRVIVVDDDIDTTEAGWHILAVFSAFQRRLSGADTARRLYRRR